VFAAILSGCSDDEGGISSAKMCMMLAQTFYTEKPEEFDSFAFVRRMSIRNQLPSSQRTMLLLHLMDRDVADKQGKE
jgi:hypothetical protein